MLQYISLLNEIKIHAFLKLNSYIKKYTIKKIDYDSLQILINKIT